MGTRRFRHFFGGSCARFLLLKQWVEQFKKICFGVGVMMNNRNRRKIVRLGVERLEERAVPATFGVPWADPSRLTLSFAPDGTSVAGQSELVVPAAQCPAANRGLAAGDPASVSDLGRSGEHQHRPGD